MDSIRLKNYRCFKDTGTINLKPINILVGANSSGKSSFLKFFPLLRQGIRTNLNGTLLWFGNDVDFKDFKNTVFCKENTMTIEYSIKEIKKYNKKTILKDAKINFSIIAENEHFDRLKELNISFKNADIKISFLEGDTSILNINNESTERTHDSNIRIIINKVNFLYPNIYFSSKNDTDIMFLSLEYVKEFKEIINKIYPEYDKNHISSFIDELDDSDYFNYDSFTEKIFKLTKKHNISEEILKVLFTKNLFININRLIDIIDRNLLNYSENISYIKPIRATIERYYRYQNLNMNTIDADGSNLPMYLYNLNDRQQKNFNEWLKNLFNFELKIKALEGHIELQISEDSKDLRNPVDLGFGYTQLLPILAIVWKNIYLDSRRGRFISLNDKKTIVIEQPELHLHPKFQGMFAHMLSKMVRYCKNKNINICFIIETHSETILNVLGEDVENDILEKEDTNVLLFEQDKNGVSTIKGTKYDEEGILEDWPLNFLEHVN